MYVNEVRVLNSFLENSTKERDKLKLDIQVTFHQTMEIIPSKPYLGFCVLKETVSVISRDPSWKEGKARFITVHLKRLCVMRTV